MSYVIEYLQDMLLLTWWCQPIRESRRGAWREHIRRYVLLKAHTAVGPLLLGTEGIDFIAPHLDILDRKLGSLLTFHGMVAGVLGVYLNVFVGGNPAPLSPFFWWFASVWAGTTVLCILAMAWIPWGDLGGGTIVEAEARQVEALTGTVITRTAFFRLAVPLTIVWLVLLGATLKTTKVQSKTAEDSPVPPAPGVTTPPAPAASQLLATIGSFSSGSGCSLVPLEPSVRNAVSEIGHVHADKIRLVGSADAQELRRESVKEYANNRGLALTRARCVAGWLKQAVPTILQFDLTTQDAANRSVTARRHGDPSDRTVQVWSAP
jgi:hypothetical protein